MPSLDYIELMRLYARRGIADWKAARYDLKKRAGECLGMPIAENEAEANVTLTTIFNTSNSNRLRFIPMPKHPKSGIERCFFIPLREIKGGGRETVGFELFLLVARRECLAFRFEPAHPPQSSHGYGHVQLCQKMIKKTIDIKLIPSWLPQSCPAFPISTSDPLRMFLCMATAVHGYQGGLDTLLKEMLQSASHPGLLSSYLGELRSTLT